MKLSEDEVRIPSPDGEIRAVVIRPVGDGRWPGGRLLQRHLPAHRVHAAYRATPGVARVRGLRAGDLPARDLAGVALEFDDAGKEAGLAGAAATTTAQFDSDRVAVLDHLAARDDIGDLYASGFCIGGHLAFRAAFDPRVAATVCFYPTGLHDGALGGDADAGSLARAADVAGRLMVVFGTRDPHVPAAARLQILSALYAAGAETSSCTSMPAASTRSCATSALATTPTSPTPPWRRRCRSSTAADRRRCRSPRPDSRG